MKPRRGRKGRKPASRRADRRNNVALIIRRLETYDIDKFAFAFRQIAVRQPGLRSFQILEERDSFHHLVAGPTAHGRYHGCVSLIRPKLQMAKSRKIVHPVRALRSIRFFHPVTLTSLIPNVASPRRGRNQREPMAMINAMNDRGRESAGIARPPTGSRDDALRRLDAEARDRPQSLSAGRTCLG